MTRAPDTASEPARLLPSGIAGLDTILKGGFLRGGIHLIQGDPGSGKTILGDQICFNHAAAGGTALFVTLLAESHERMLAHHQGLAFFDETLIPASVTYVSAYAVLEKEGLPGLLQLLRREVQARGASVLVLDGLITAEESAGSRREFKRFVHGLQAQAALTDCTMFLLSSTAPRPTPSEHTMVDGIVELASQLFGRSAERTLEVLKRRGLGFLRGRHSFRITDAGIVVFPRIEALLGKPTREDRIPEDKLPSGIPRLDDMLGGGLPENSTTMLVGPSGCGKTIAGLQFLGGCSADQPGLFFGLFETPARLHAKAKHLKLPIEQSIGAGHVEIIWQPMTEGVLDEIGNRMLDAVQRRKVRRLFLDGLNGLEELAVEPARLNRFIAALSNEFRGMGVATMFTHEADLLGPADLPMGGLALREVSGITENIVVMRFVELRTRLYRMVSVIKVRDSDFQHRMRCYRIGEGGITIDGDPERAEAILVEALGGRGLER
ncbi:MAG TPA: ATPase domain-containing protein [Acetobacteraceae bacterium]|nr:ATPase domain-containing protein [Acetobacteraceae bacterium]